MSPLVDLLNDPSGSEVLPIPDTPSRVSAIDKAPVLAVLAVSADGAAQGVRWKLQVSPPREPTWAGYEDSLG